MREVGRDANHGQFQLVSATTQLKLLAGDGKNLLLHYNFAGVGLSSVIYLYKINSFRCD